MMESLIPLEYTQILVPIDCTPKSQSGVDAARRLIGPMLGAHITLMATVSPIPETLDAASAEKLRDARYRHAEQALEAMGRILTNWGVYHHRVVVEGEDLADALGRATADGKYDLIALNRAFLTDPDEEDCLAHRIVRSTPTPILIMPMVQ